MYKLFQKWQDKSLEYEAKLLSEYISKDTDESHCLDEGLGAGNDGCIISHYKNKEEASRFLDKDTYYEIPYSSIPTGICGNCLSHIDGYCHIGRKCPHCGITFKDSDQLYFD